MRVALLTTLWKRPALTACALRSGLLAREALSGSVDIELLAVGSEGIVSRALAEDHGWRYVEAPNRPIGVKLNAGFAALRSLDVDGVVAHGSDDFADLRLVSAWARASDEGKLFCGLLDMYKVRVGDYRVFHWTGYQGARRGDSIGPWRFVASSVLDVLDWAPYDPALSRNLDGSMTDKLNARLPRWKEYSYTVSMKDVGASVFDVSTPERISSWTDIVNSPGVIDGPSWKELTAFLPHELSYAIRKQRCPRSSSEVK